LDGAIAIESGDVLSGLVDEESRSRSGRHVCRKLALVLLRDNGLKPVSRLGDRVVDREAVRPTYSRGRAIRYRVKLSHGDYAIQLSLVRNLWGRVKGWITVYNYRGELVYRARYCDGELRRSLGNPLYAWIVRLVVEELRIPVKRTRLGDEGGGR